MNEKELHNRIDSLENKLDKTLTLLQSLLSGSFPVAPVSDNKLQFYDWLDEWYTTYKVPHLKENSLYQIRNCINKHIKQNIDDKPLHELKPIEIEKALNKIQSSRMKKYTRDTIGDCLKQAYKLDFLSYNIMDKVSGVTHVRKKGMALSKDEEASFIKAIKRNPMEKLYLFYLLSGCRKAEALSIKWEHIDTVNNRIFIDGTKTTCAQRFIPLFADIQELLAGIPRTQEYIFPYTVWSVESNFRWLKKKYNLNFSIHSLRHTFSTRHYENGIKPKTIQKWMGHSKVELTQDIYTDVLTEFEALEVEKANKSRKLLV